MDVVFVVDPLDGLQPGHDTSVALMEAAQRRGHRVLTTTAADLAYADGRATARCTPVELRPAVLESGHWITDPTWYVPGPTAPYALDDAGAVFMRTDPPVDADYWRATYLLDRIDPRSTLVVNSPAGIRHANEKLYGLEFADLMPDTLVTADRAEIRRQVEVWRRAVLKPTDVMGGRGIFTLDADDPNLGSILDTGTVRGTTQVVVQRWVADVARTGDRRVVVLDGRPVGALTRLAESGDFRCNMATGGRVVADQVTARDRELCAAMAPSMREHGLHLVGIDVIGGLVTEINVTSPTGIREIDALSGSSLAGDVIAWTEAARPGR